MAVRQIVKHLIENRSLSYSEVGQMLEPAISKQQVSYLLNTKAESVPQKLIDLIRVLNAELVLRDKQTGDIIEVEKPSTTQSKKS